MSAVSQTEAADLAVGTEKQIGLWGLVALAAGQVVGAGVVTLVGATIPLTGRSVWLAYGAAVVLGFCTIFPYIMLACMMRVKGGNYTFVSSLLGDKWGGMFGLAFTLNMFAVGMIALSFGSYLNALMPQIDVKTAAIVVLTIFWISSMLGIDFMAKIQKIMMVALIVGMFGFIIAGLFNLRPGTFDFSAPEFFTGGFDGFCAAVMVLVFSCIGHSYVVAFSKEAKEAKKNIPYAIIISSVFILVLYTLVGIVASGVLPLEEVAGKPLTVVASAILPGPVYYAFIILGPLMVLTTTINSCFGVFSKPLVQMARDGWFPRSFAATNRRGAPYYVMTVLYIMAVLPVAVGLDIRTITSNVVLIQRLIDIMAIAAVISLPGRLSDAWDNRYFRMSKPVYYTVMSFSMLVTLFILGISLRNLTATLIGVTATIVAFCYIYTTIRQKMGRVKIEKSYELQ